MDTIHLPYRLAAAFADGTRTHFDAINETQARAAMEAAQALHVDIIWFDAVTDEHYDHGVYFAARPATPEIALFDLTDKEDAT